MATHLSVVPIGLDEDAFKTGLDIVDVVVVLWLRGEGNEEREYTDGCRRSWPEWGLDDWGALGGAHFSTHAVLSWSI
jgi:hypothetical protein